LNLNGLSAQKTDGDELGITELLLLLGLAESDALGTADVVLEGSALKLLLGLAEGDALGTADVILEGIVLDKKVGTIVGTLIQ